MKKKNRKDFFVVMKILSNYPKKDNNENLTYLPLIIMMLLAAVGTIVFVIVTRPTKAADVPEITAEPIPIEEPIIEVIEEEPEESHRMTDDEIIAMVVMAEAGNQELLGKVAVAMTILNRCDAWGKTVEEVINEPNQYTFPYYGTVSEECFRAVEIARENRDLFPEDMFYFRTTHYHTFGEPYMVIGSHYFSTQGE